MQSAQFQLHAQIEDRHWWFVARRRIMARLVRAVLPAGAGHRVLDVGCGTGANLAALAEGYDCVGIDASQDAIDLARARFPALRFVRGFAPQDLDLGEERIRLALLMDVLEHVHDDFLLLSELLAAASPGTMFLVTVPADESLWSPHDESFGHYRRYSLPRLERVWQGLPVSVLLASYFNARLAPLVRWSRSRSQSRAAGAAGTDFWLPPRPLNSLLTAVFAGEGRRLEAQLAGRRSRAYDSGVSLVALLRREVGHIEPRTRPSDVAPDCHGPAVELAAHATA